MPKRQEQNYKAVWSAPPDPRLVEAARDLLAELVLRVVLREAAEERAAPHTTVQQE